MPSIPLLLGGVALAASLTAGLFYYRSEAIRYEAAAATAIAANASLVKDAAVAKAEAIRNQAISADALRDTAAISAQVAAIKERLRNGTACTIDPADADALDRLFKP